jgi:hypothetical protein
MGSSFTFTEIEGSDGGGEGEEMISEELEPSMCKNNEMKSQLIDSIVPKYYS